MKASCDAEYVLSNPVKLTSTAPNRRTLVAASTITGDGVTTSDACCVEFGRVKLNTIVPAVVPVWNWMLDCPLNFAIVSPAAIVTVADAWRPREEGDRGIVRKAGRRLEGQCQRAGATHRRCRRERNGHIVLIIAGAQCRAEHNGSRRQGLCEALPGELERALAHGQRSLRGLAGLRLKSHLERCGLPGSELHGRGEADGAAEAGSSYRQGADG